MGWNKKTKAFKPKPKQEKPHVFVGVPIERGSDGVGVGVYRFLQLLGVLNFTDKHPYTYSWQIIVDKKPVEWARNCLVGSAIKCNADWLWFIDNDMVPPPNAFAQLQAKGDIIAGTALGFDHANESKGTPTRLKLCLFDHHPTEETFQTIIPQQGEVEREIDAAGTATMLIRRKVFTDERLWGDTKYTDLYGKEKDIKDEYEEEEWGPPLFRFIRKCNGQGLRGEDLDFCWRAKQLGYRVVGTPGIRWGHQKHVNLDSVLDLVNNTAAAYGQQIMEQNNANQGEVQEG